MAVEARLLLASVAQMSPDPHNLPDLCLQDRKSRHERLERDAAMFQDHPHLPPGAIRRHKGIAFPCRNHPIISFIPGPFPSSHVKLCDIFFCRKNELTNKLGE